MSAYKKIPNNWITICNISISILPFGDLAVDAYKSSSELSIDFLTLLEKYVTIDYSQFFIVSVGFFTSRSTVLSYIRRTIACLGMVNVCLRQCWYTGMSYRR